MEYKIQVSSRIFMWCNLLDLLWGYSFVEKTQLFYTRLSNSIINQGQDDLLEKQPQRLLDCIKLQPPSTGGSACS